MALFKILKGSSSALGKTGNSTYKATEGYAYFTQDDGKFYIDIADANQAQVGVNRIPLNARAADYLIGTDVAGRNLIQNTLFKDNNNLPNLNGVYHFTPASNCTLTASDAHGLILRETAACQAALYLGSSSNTANANQIKINNLDALAVNTEYTLAFDLDYKLLSGATNSTTYYINLDLYVDKTTAGTFDTTALQSKRVAEITSARKGITVTGTRVEFTFVLPTNVTMLYFRLYCTNTTANQYAAGDFLQLNNIKLERGPVATYWTPAPEDERRYIILNNKTLQLGKSYTLGDVNLASGNGRIFYGTCATAAGTAAKEVVCTAYDSLKTGDMLIVSFTNNNSAAVANLTLNVNGKGAKSIKKQYNTSLSNLTATGELRADTTATFVYNGTYWILTNADYNSTYAYMRPYENTSTSGAAKQAKIAEGGWRFQLSAGKHFAYTHYYDNTFQGALTLNIANTGAKPIWINGKPSSATNYTLPGGSYIVYYDGANYHFRTDGIMPGTTSGGGNLIAREYLSSAACTMDNYDPITRTFTLSIASNATATRAGLTIASNKVYIPWGYSFVLSCEIWSPVAAIWHYDENTSLETNPEGIAGNDFYTEHAGSASTIPANTWTKVWYKHANTREPDTSGGTCTNPDRRGLYEWSTFGIAITDATKGKTFKIRNVLGYYGNEPSANFSHSPVYGISNITTGTKAFTATRIDGSTFTFVGPSTSVLDSSNNTNTTFAYSKSGLNYADYTWLAAWNGYELRAVNKSQFAQAGHNHDTTYLKLDGTNNMTANVNIIAGDTDKFVNFWYDANKRAGASWRIGALGSGSVDTNYFVIQSGTSSTSATTWNNTIRIGMNTYDVGLSGNLYPLVTATKDLGTSSLRWNNIYANTLWGTAKHASAAHWSTSAGSPSGVLKVKIKKKTSWMLAFTIRVYQAYDYTDIGISGYNYGSNMWYSPKAVIIGGTSTEKLTVSFGYDDDAVSNYRTLWVSIPVKQYTGIDVFNITNGYTQIDLYDAFEIIQETTSTGTVQTTKDAYRPWYRDETVTNATNAAKVAITTAAPTSSGVVGYLPLSSAISGNNSLKVQESLYVYDTVANNTITNTYLCVGKKNSIIGGITLQAGNAYYGDLIPATLTANRTWTLPDATGTVAIISPSGVLTATTFDGNITWSNITGKPSTYAPSAHSHSEIVTVGDNRSVATTPNDYKNKIIFQGLKTNSAFGSPSTNTYSYVIGLRGWSDSSGGHAHELAFNDNGINWRHGSTTTWGDWTRLLDSGTTYAASTSTVSITWNTETTIATINGTAIKVKIPANPNTNTDTLVKQTAKTDSVEYKLLATTSASPTSGNAAEAIYSTDIAINPSSHLLTITRANHSGDTGFIVNNTDSTNPLKIGYIIGNSGNGGIYDYTHGAWKVQIAASGTTTFHGNATTATTASKLSNTDAIGATDRPVYFTSGGVPATVTYRMVATNVAATTALAITDNLNTGIWYVNGTNVTGLYSQSDGVAYVNKYSDSWIHEIYGDYRTGRIAVRGKNNGTWQEWRQILDHKTTYAASSSAISVGWNTETTIATINGTAVKIKIPTKPTYSDVGAAAATHYHNCLNGLGRLSASAEAIAFNTTTSVGNRMSWCIYDSASRSKDATNSPSFDASTLNMPWDWGAYMTQLALENAGTRLQIRGANHVDHGEGASPRYTPTYTAWREIVTADKATQMGSATQPVYINNKGQVVACTTYANASVGTADKLTGFSSRSATMGWGNQTGSVITCLASPSGGGWGFRDNNPANGQLSMTIDGTIYIKEGVQDISAAIKALSISNATVTYTNLWGGTGTAFTIPTTVGTSTLAWNTEVTLGTIAGLAIKAKLPANPNTNTDTLVKQTAKTDNVEYKLLATTSASPSSGTAMEATYDINVSINPSTHTLTASTYKVTSNATITYNSTTGCLEITV